MTTADYCSRCTDPPVNLFLELLHLRQELSPNPEGTRHLFAVENHGLGLGGADSHPSCFTLGCKLLSDNNRKKKNKKNKKNNMKQLHTDRVSGTLSNPNCSSQYQTG